MTPSHRSKDSNTSLLLLSSPPSPPTRPALHAAYHGPLTSSLSRLSPSSNLTIALAAPFFPLCWKRLQSLLAGLYSLIASVEATNTTGVDVTVILVDHVRGRTYPPDRIPPPNDTTILDLGAFASMPRRWEHVFHASTEASYELLTAFLQTAERTQTFLQQQIISLPGGLSLTNETSRPPNDGSLERVDTRRQSVILAGTFDHLHPGHKLLLQASALLLALPHETPSASQQASLIIGISDDLLLKNKKFASELESWPVRVHSVLSFLSTIFSSPLPEARQERIGDSEEVRAQFCGNKILVRCVSISDVYGPTITEETIDAIVISGETRSGGAAVNKKRVEQGWKELEVHEIDMLNIEAEGDDQGSEKAQDDFSAKISSTEIRRRKAEAKEQR